MEQEVFKCQGMVERGLNANHMMITEFTNKHKMDANGIGKHLSRLYDRVDQLQGQIYDLQNQNCERSIHPSSSKGAFLPSSWEAMEARRRLDLFLVVAVLVAILAASLVRCADAARPVPPSPATALVSSLMEMLPMGPSRRGAGH
ncbi:40s ribosomal protein s5-1 [Hordeum vulgare]|nr:40s ribosomal protein s5-1 [Hordeum vulgare]